MVLYHIYKMPKDKHNAHGGFTPAAVAPPIAINPVKVIHTITLSGGAVWGTGTVPSFITGCPSPRTHHSARDSVLITLLPLSFLVSGKMMCCFDKDPGEFVGKISVRIRTYGIDGCKPVFPGIDTFSAGQPEQELCITIRKHP